MLSIRVKYAVRILHELEKEKDLGNRLGTAELKRRIQADMGGKEIPLIVRRLSEAGLVERDFKGGVPKYSLSDAYSRITLHEVVMAVEGGVYLGFDYKYGWDFDICSEYIRLTAADRWLENELTTLLESIPLESILPSAVEQVYPLEK